MIKWDSAKDGQMYGHGLMNHCIIEAHPNSPIAQQGFRYLAHAGLERKLCLTRKQAVLWCQARDNNLKRRTNEHS